jgi:hypothetical protein
LLLVLRLLDWDWNHDFLGFRHNATRNESRNVSSSKAWWWWNVAQITGWRSRNIRNIDSLNLLDDSICLSDINRVLLKNFFFLLLIFNQLLLFLLKKFDLFSLTS